MYLTLAFSISDIIASQTKKTENYPQYPSSSWGAYRVSESSAIYASKMGDNSIFSSYTAGINNLPSLIHCAKVEQLSLAYSV